MKPDQPCWGGPYIAKLPNDPWDKAFIASEDSASNTVTIRSNGPDGTTGTSDDITYVQ